MSYSASNGVVHTNGGAGRGTGANGRAALPNVALEVEGIWRRFGGVEALRDVGFNVAPGEVVGLVGPNGSGKTTLVNIISGLDTPDAGRVRLGGLDVTGHLAHEVAACGLARTYQNLRLFGRLDALQNVRVGALRRERMGFAWSLLHPLVGRNRADAGRVAALAALSRVGIARLADAPVAALSHGDQRRVELARAVAAQPSVLLLDEPVAGLSARERAPVVRLIRELRAAGRAVVVVEHNLALVRAVADRVVVLDAGQVLATGRPEEVFALPAVRTAFLGPA